MFLQFLCEKLMDRPSEVPPCCSSRCSIRCWHHDIKDVEIEGLEDKDPTSVGSSLQTVETGQEVRFKIKWQV